MEEKTVTIIDGDETIKYDEPSISDEQLFNDYAFIIAQKQAKLLYDNGFINRDEFNKIADLNKIKFKPSNAEILV